MLDANNIQGSLGEISVTKTLYQQGYIVFTQYSGFSPFDLVAYKDNVLYRISVKSSTYQRGNKWRVDITQKNITYNTVYKTPFDKNSCDILAVYLPVEDRVLLFNSEDISVKTQLSIPVLA